MIIIKNDGEKNLNGEGLFNRVRKEMREKKEETIIFDFINIFYTLNK